MEDKKKEYNREYKRQKRGSTRRQSYGNTLENTVRIEFRIKEEHSHQLKEIAKSQEKGVNQLLREIIENFLHLNL